MENFDGRFITISGSENIDCSKVLLIKNIEYIPMKLTILYLLF